MSRESIDRYRFHYVYRMNHPSEHYYYGIHSSNDPYADKYMGSGVDLKKIWQIFPKKEWNKEIVCIFDRRIDAAFEEGVIVNEKTLSDPMCLNRIRGKKA